MGLKKHFSQHLFPKSRVSSHSNTKNLINPFHKPTKKKPKKRKNIQLHSRTFSILKILLFFTSDV